MRVLYHNRHRDRAAERELGVEHAELGALLQSSDFVSLHVPLTSATTGLIGARELALMRPGGYLVNAARGCPVGSGWPAYLAIRRARSTA